MFPIAYHCNTVKSLKFAGANFRRLRKNCIFMETYVRGPHAKVSTHTYIYLVTDIRCIPNVMV